VKKRNETQTLKLHKETIQLLVDPQRLRLVLGEGVARLSVDPSGCSATTLECCQ
jgi:hypothetical protein